MDELPFALLLGATKVTYFNGNLYVVRTDRKCVMVYQGTENNPDCLDRPRKHFGRDH